METRTRSALASWPRIPLAAPAVAIACSALLFGVAGRNSSYLVIDSGPYVSVASHLAREGRVVSSFNFVGNFERLPGPPNFVPPGMGLLMAGFQLLVGSPVVAAKCLLFCCLVITQLCASSVVARLTGSRGYALGASLVLMCTPRVASFSGMVLSELPFVTFMAAGILAGVLALEEDPHPWAKWIGLPLAAAGLCSTRYLGVFFPLAFAAVWAGVALRGSGGAKGIARAAAFCGYIGLVALGPVVAWLALARSAAPVVLPVRPPSRFGTIAAVVETLSTLGAWLGPWIALAAVVTAFAAVRGAASVPVSSRWSRREAFVATCLVGYLAVLIVVRTGQALHPLDRLGSRYLSPAWLPAFVLGAISIHRWVWSRRGRAPKLAVGVLAAVVAAWGAVEMLGFRVPQPFPTGTETYRRAVDLVFENDTVLCNYGQTLVVDRPDLLVIGIPSREDFEYEVDLGDAVRRHDVGWLVLFEVAGKEIMYPPEVVEWFARPPREVAVRRVLKLKDGVIYQLGRKGVGPSEERETLPRTRTGS